MPDNQRWRNDPERYRYRDDDRRRGEPDWGYPPGRRDEYRGGGFSGADRESWYAAGNPIAITAADPIAAVTSARTIGETSAARGAITAIRLVTAPADRRSTGARSRESAGGIAPAGASPASPTSPSGTASEPDTRAATGAALTPAAATSAASSSDDDAARRRREDERGEHRGRGPKGYQRSDERIRDDVNDRLTDDPHIDASEVEVAVSAREVTLSGTVSSRFEKRRAEDIAESVSGVTHVQNNLRVQQSAGAGRDAGLFSGGGMGASGATGGPAAATSSAGALGGADVGPPRRKTSSGV
jgi:hypothetical protein